MNQQSAKCFYVVWFFPKNLFFQQLHNFSSFGLKHEILNKTCARNKSEQDHSMMSTMSSQHQGCLIYIECFAIFFNLLIVSHRIGAIIYGHTIKVDHSIKIFIGFVPEYCLWFMVIKNRESSWDRDCLIQHKLSQCVITRKRCSRSDSETTPKIKQKWMKVKR